MGKKVQLENGRKMHLQKSNYKMEIIPNVEWKVKIKFKLQMKMKIQLENENSIWKFKLKTIWKLDRKVLENNENLTNGGWKKKSGL